jgi:hypothetical protein
MQHHLRATKRENEIVPNSLRWTQEEYMAHLKRMDELRYGQAWKDARPPLPLPLRPYTQPFDRFLELCAAAKLPIPAREVLVIPNRDYRFDYAWPCAKVAVEQQGFRDHSTRKGLQRDYDKLNLAQAAGWKVFQFTPKQLASVETIEWLRGQLVANEQNDAVASKVE